MKLKWYNVSIDTMIDRDISIFITIPKKTVDLNSDNYKNSPMWSYFNRLRSEWKFTKDILDKVELSIINNSVIVDKIIKAIEAKDGDWLKKLIEEIENIMWLSNQELVIFKWLIAWNLANKKQINLIGMVLWNSTDTFLLEEVKSNLDWYSESPMWVYFNRLRLEWKFTKDILDKIELLFLNNVGLFKIKETDNSIVSIFSILLGKLNLDVSERQVIWLSLLKVSKTKNIKEIKK